MKPGTRCVIIGGFTENIGKECIVVCPIDYKDLRFNCQWYEIKPLSSILVYQTRTGITEWANIGNIPVKYLMQIDPDSRFDVEPIEETSHV